MEAFERLEMPGMARFGSPSGALLCRRMIVAARDETAADLPRTAGLTGLPLVMPVLLPEKKLRNLTRTVPSFPVYVKTRLSRTFLYSARMVSPLPRNPSPTRLLKFVWFVRVYCFNGTRIAAHGMGFTAAPIPAGAYLLLERR
jgi:hypothetical protein